MPPAHPHPGAGPGGPAGASITQLKCLTAFRVQPISKRMAADMGSAITDRNIEMQMKQKKRCPNRRTERVLQTDHGVSMHCNALIMLPVYRRQINPIAVDAAAAAAIEPLATCCTLLWRSAENKVVYY